MGTEHGELAAGAGRRASAVGDHAVGVELDAYEVTVDGAVEVSSAPRTEQRMRGQRALRERTDGSSCTACCNTRHCVRIAHRPRRTMSRHTYACSASRTRPHRNSPASRRNARLAHCIDSSDRRWCRAPCSKPMLRRCTCHRSSRWWFHRDTNAWSRTNRTPRGPRSSRTTCATHIRWLVRCPGRRSRLPCR